MTTFRSDESSRRASRIMHRMHGACIAIARIGNAKYAPSSARLRKLQVKDSSRILDSHGSPHWVL